MIYKCAYNDETNVRLMWPVCMCYYDNTILTLGTSGYQCKNLYLNIFVVSILLLLHLSKKVAAALSYRSTI